MPPSADTLHVYATTLLISAVCTSILLDCAAWSTPPMLHMYMADVMPVEAVWQVKLKLLPSSTVPEALLVMVGVWGTTAQKHKKHCLFHIQAVSPFLTGRMFVRPNILRTLRRTMIRFLIEHLVRRIWFGQSKLYFILNWLVMRCKLRPELAADAQQTA